MRRGNSTKDRPSDTVKALIVGSGIALSERGTHVLKGVHDEWRLFAAAESDP